MFEIRPRKNRLKKYFGSGNPAKSWPATLPRSRQGPSQSASPERHGLYFVLIEWTDKVLCVHHCISLYHNPMIRRNSVCNLIPSFAHTLRLPFLPIWAEPSRENYEHHAWPSSEFPSLLFFFIFLMPTARANMIEGASWFRHLPISSRTTQSHSLWISAFVDLERRGNLCKEKKMKVEKKSHENVNLCVTHVWEMFVKRWKTVCISARLRAICRK